jgi:Rap guanine nucleotide exchange factor 1
VKEDIPALQLTICFSCRTYSFKKHERIIAFFNNFDEFLCEEAMWQISESIKPRGGKKAQ